MLTIKRKEKILNISFFFSLFLFITKKEVLTDYLSGNSRLEPVQKKVITRKHFYEILTLTNKIFLNTFSLTKGQSFKGAKAVNFNQDNPPTKKRKNLLPIETIEKYMQSFGDNRFLRQYKNKKDSYERMIKYKFDGDVEAMEKFTKENPDHHFFHIKKCWEIAQNYRGKMKFYLKIYFDELEKAELRKKRMEALGQQAPAINNTTKQPSFTHHQVRPKKSSVPHSQPQHSGPKVERGRILRKTVISRTPIKSSAPCSQHPYKSTTVREVIRSKVITPTVKREVRPRVIRKVAISS